MAWVPPGVEVNTPEHWPLAKDEVNHVGDPVAARHRRRPLRRRRRRRGRRRRVRPAAGRHRPRGGARGRGRLVHEALGTNKSHEWSLGGGDLEAGFAEADVIVERRIVNHRTSGAAIEPRAVLAEYRAGSADALDARPRSRTSCASSWRCMLGDQRGARPRDRARGRRRLRLQAADLRRGDLAARGPRASSSGPIKWVETRSERHGHDAPRPRPDRLRADGRQARRHDHRLPREDHRRPRRLPHAADAVDPVARRRS